MEKLSYYITRILLEGGHVFGEGSDPIKKEDIPGTLKNFINEFAKIFPNSKNYLEPTHTLGSVGKKDISGDIDLAVDEKSLEDAGEWGLEPTRVDELYALYKKRARTSTPQQIMKRAVLVAISEKINSTSKLINTDTKSAGNGVLFCEFPQYADGKENGKMVQIDINFGDVDWLEFAYFSDSYAGNVKGLHRTQLLLHLFSYKGYTFGHNYGVKSRDTQEIVAAHPEEAIELLNKLYGFRIDANTLQNYHKLQEFLKAHLSEGELNGVYDIYLKTLDSTRCDVPEDLQAYWIENKERLGLTGKFLPSDSRLQCYK